MTTTMEAVNVLASSTFEAFLEGAKHAEVLAVDTETNGEDIRDGRGFCVGISLAYRIPGIGCAYRYFPLRHGDSGDLDRVQFAQLKEVIEGAKLLVAHNMKFDLVSLRTAGINYTGRFFCTLLMAHLLHETKPFSKSLNDCIKHYVPGEESKKESPEWSGWIATYGWGKPMPSDLMEPYAEYDAYLHLRLFEVLHELWTKKEPILFDYWPFKERFVRLIIGMESRGVRIDEALCRRMEVIGNEQMGEILDLLGYDTLGSKAYTDLLLDKLGLPVVKTSKKTGKPSFDKEAMKVYEQILERQENDTAELILTYRGWQKSVSSNYRAYTELVSPDGRLRPNYKLHGTKTGRMSCEKPNLQQIPRVSDKSWNGEMKKCFIPEDGYRLYEADYSQLELRLATAYADIASLKQVFKEGRDIFSEMASDLTMVRQDTKTFVYSTQYGAGLTRLMHVFGWSKEKANAIRENYYRTYPGFRRVSNMAQAKCRRAGQLRLWSGRSRHFQWPEDEAHKAFNSVIQGGSADIVERTMLRLDEAGCNNDECRMLLQVHDSVVFEIKEGREDYYLPLIKKTMEDIPEPFGVTFAVDVKEWGKG